MKSAHVSRIFVDTNPGSAIPILCVLLYLKPNLTRWSFIESEIYNLVFFFYCTTKLTNKMEYNTPRHATLCLQSFSGVILEGIYFKNQFRSRSGDRLHSRGLYTI